MVARFGIIAIKFVEKPFFNTFLGFTAGWDYKHYIEYTSQKIVNLNSTNNKHLNCDVFDGSKVNGLRQPILSSFVLDKPSGYKVFCNPETLNYEQLNKSVLITITFYLEDDNNEEVDFNQEVLTFTIRLIKIQKEVFRCGKPSNLSYDFVNSIERPNINTNIRIQTLLKTYKTTFK